mmetsp:Transcript_35069/g.92238  ORF Transcript_35069/g.92238 Transcript_35069/m.92238 type:complete len:214 (-) Transcript_35069:90-731(-)
MGMRARHTPCETRARTVAATVKIVSRQRAGPAVTTASRVLARLAISNAGTGRPGARAVIICSPGWTRRPSGIELRPARDDPRQPPCRCRPPAARPQGTARRLHLRPRAGRGACRAAGSAGPCALSSAWSAQTAAARMWRQGARPRGLRPPPDSPAHGKDCGPSHCPSRLAAGPPSNPMSARPPPPRGTAASRCPDAARLCARRDWTKAGAPSA